MQEDEELELGEDPEIYQSYWMMHNKDGMYSLRNGFHITHLAHLQVPFITYPIITIEVSVHLFIGIMTLK